MARFYPFYPLGSFQFGDVIKMPRGTFLHMSFGERLNPFLLGLALGASLLS